MTPVVRHEVFAGAKVGLLTLKSETKVGYRRYWLCECDCGGTKTADAAGLKRGQIRSCRCLHKGRVKHGMATSGEYRSWDHAKQRCTNPNIDAAEHYIGRGITMCERWFSSFENFYADMGPRPTPKHSLDRYPDNDGNYEPGNCRWATQSEQIRNSSRIIAVKARGEECKRGHAFTAQNTAIHNGYRECRECNRLLKAVNRSKA